VIEADDAERLRSAGRPHHRDLRRLQTVLADGGHGFRAGAMIRLEGGGIGLLFHKPKHSTTDCGK
jgi:hypothetical protein